MRKVVGKRASVLTSLEVRDLTHVTYIRPTSKKCMTVQCLAGLGGQWSCLGGWLNKVKQMPIWIILAQVTLSKIAELFSLPFLDQGF